MKNRSLLILAVCVLAICLGAIWYLQLPPPAPRTAPVELPPVAVATPEPSKVPAVMPVAVAATPVPKVEPKAEPKPLAEWEVKIETLLRSSIGETETAQLLINLLPTLPPEGQAQAAQHISNLLLDKDYNRLLPLVKNSRLSEEVLDVFVSDLMNRDDAVKLPTLLEIAKLPAHPHHEEALQDLQIFLDGDFGSDWNKWDASMKDYLRKQAKENADAALEEPTVGQPKPARTSP